MPMSAKREIHSGDIAIEQRRPLEGDVITDASEIVRADAIMNDEEIQSLAFNEEPITIILNPSNEPNAPDSVYCAVNGIGIEIWAEKLKRWVQWKYAPIGQRFMTKRKYVEVLARSKVDRVITDYDEPGVARPVNRVRGNTTGYQTFQVIRDDNPKGQAWLTELLRRYW